MPTSRVRDEGMPPSVEKTGGIHVEVLRDISIGLLPIHPDDCVDMIREIKGAALA